MKRRKTGGRALYSWFGPVGIPLAPSAQQDLDDLTHRLAIEPPEVRRRAVASLVANSSPQMLDVVTDAVLAALLRSEETEHRTALADALAQFGPTVANRATTALVKTKLEWQRVVLGGVLERVGPLLKGNERMGMFVGLSGFATKFAGTEAATALERAATAIRNAINQDSASEEAS